MKMGSSFPNLLFRLIAGVDVGGVLSSNFRFRRLVCVLAASPLVVAGSAMAENTPNFSGVWEDIGSAGDQPPTASIAAEDELLEELFGSRKPPGGEADLKEPYATLYEETKLKEHEALLGGMPLSNPHELCVPEGMPQLMMPTMPIEIVQLPDKIVVVAEYLGQVRRIYLNENMPDSDEITPTFTGYSVGYWENDTLVVETKAILEEAMFFHFPHSEDLKVKEYIRLTGPDLLEVRMVSEDAKALNKPYEVTFNYKRANGYRPIEYICTKNRYEYLDGKSILIID